MLRFKLFCFFTGMAAISLFRPKDGMAMIEAAQEGSQRKLLRETASAVFGRTQKPESPQEARDS